MGFLGNIQPEKFIYLNHKKKQGKPCGPPCSTFQLAKISLDGLLPSRAHLRFPLQKKYNKKFFELMNYVINRKFKKVNFVSTIFMNGQGKKYKVQREKYKVFQFCS